MKLLKKVFPLTLILMFVLFSHAGIYVSHLHAQDAPKTPEVKAGTDVNKAADITIEENAGKTIKNNEVLEKAVTEKEPGRPDKSENQAKRSATGLEKTLEKLNNLYVPIHWSDSRNGLAIGGYDPITYFELGNAKAGDDIFQIEWHGVTWRFVSKGNMQAFKRTPSIYAPRFAGYDPYALSNGLLSEGLPSVWSIIEGKLYLFHNEVNLFLWHENRTKLTNNVNKNWKELSIDLPRYKIRQ